MGKKKLLIILILIAIILNLLLLVYLTSYKLNVFNEDFYKKEFTKYNVYGIFPDKDIDKINSEILMYLKDKRGDFNKDLFNQREIDHLNDVKSVMQKADIFYYSLIILSIILITILFRLDKKHFLINIASVLFFSWLSILLSAVIAVCLISLNFENFFTLFHNVFFPQGNWLFNASDNIIKLYPSKLFYDLGKNIFTDALIYGNILIVAAILHYWRKK